jgi:hypothetical protein
MYRQILRDLLSISSIIISNMDMDVITETVKTNLDRSE